MKKDYGVLKIDTDSILDRRNHTSNNDSGTKERNEWRKKPLRHREIAVSSSVSSRKHSIEDGNALTSTDFGDNSCSLPSSNPRFSAQPAPNCCAKSSLRFALFSFSVCLIDDIVVRSASEVFLSFAAVSLSGNDD